MVFSIFDNALAGQDRMEPFLAFEESHGRHVQLTFDAAPSRRPRGGSWLGISKEPGGKGSFQAVKLQRPARTAVCSHSTRDMAAMGSTESKHDIDDTQDECLSSCRQS
jgi:hypothetical protein